MPFISWSIALSVKIAMIDTQHQKLVDIINELHDAMMMGKGKDALASTFIRLGEYTRTHFAAEEGLMKTYGYPDFTAHKAEHDRLTQQVKDLTEQLGQGKYTLTMETNLFLKEWLVNHVMGVDKKYSGYLNAKGVH
jgi:hemerythrin